MPVVPFSRVEPRIDDSLMPSDVHLAMAAANMAKPFVNMGESYDSTADKLRTEEHKMEGRQRYQDSVNPEEQLGKVEKQDISDKPTEFYPGESERITMTDKEGNKVEWPVIGKRPREPGEPNLDYAKPGDDWNKIIRFKDLLLDPDKLSPKHLKWLKDNGAKGL